MAGKLSYSIFSTFITQILIFFLGILVSVILARQLGPEIKGVYSIVTLFPSLLVYFTSFSLGQAAIYYIGKAKYSRKEIYGSTIILGFFISIICFIGGGLMLLCHNLFFPGIELKYLIIGIFAAPCQIFFGYLGYTMLAIQRIWKYNFFSFLQALLFFIFIVVIYLLNSIKIEYLIIGEIAIYLFVLFFMFIALNKEMGATRPEFNFDYAKKAFAFGSRVYLGNILSFASCRFNILIINFLTNPFQVGLWSVAIAISEKLWFFSDAVGTVLFPRTAAENDKENLKELTPRVFRSVMVINSLMVVLLFLFGGWIINFLYSYQYEEAVAPFKILLAGALSLSGIKIIESDLKGRGRPGLVAKISAVALAVNVALILVLIPAHGIKGAAWASTIAYISSFIFALTVYLRISGNPLNNMIVIKISDVIVIWRFFKEICHKISNSLYGFFNRNHYT